jgi:hypothetical protein
MSMTYLNQLGMISPLGNSLGATKRALLELGRVVWRCRMPFHRDGGYRWVG